ncbi:SH3 domain-containing protein [Chamaesiphon sp. GL140_3_metabinner_50]|uniref:SH3 domain-containing protein n=1 Tax=Chamaesiphon sp. GL140_3_metabinner_50 TaxID=2970812 RepID=UPI0025E70AC7|nr:SH3 domain-containing protein [Chamaesiphon sp. GL140_3_metabinner_50]
MKRQVIINAISIAMLTTFSVNIAPGFAQSGPGNYGSVNAAYSCSRDGDTINLRSRAGQQSKVLTKIPPGKSVVLIGISRVVDDYTWQKVNFYGAIGWVRGDFLCN